jgi:hypothetical protein
MDGASFPGRFVEDDKVDRHLDAPYYLVMSRNMAQAGRIREKVRLFPITGLYMLICFWTIT